MNTLIPFRTTDQDRNSETNNGINNNDENHENNNSKNSNINSDDKILSSTQSSQPSNSDLISNKLINFLTTDTTIENSSPLPGADNMEEYNNNLDNHTSNKIDRSSAWRIAGICDNNPRLYDLEGWTDTSCDQDVNVARPPLTHNSSPRCHSPSYDEYNTENLLEPTGLTGGEEINTCKSTSNYDSNNKSKSISRAKAIKNLPALFRSSVHASSLNSYDKARPLSVHEEHIFDVEEPSLDINHFEDELSSDDEMNERVLHVLTGPRNMEQTVNWGECMK
ncbi:9944_t:CDS:2 [Ambispora leptoticha]|uniref:9944_t:CDS:1 n=1 Tax=Ambispora leptoticha TaxID=144679 RepID=A0A9N9F3A3_9GLOM|nr:9944_t:CDS:2 [Ambispora leptoticha]